MVIELLAGSKERRSADTTIRSRDALFIRKAAGNPASDWVNHAPMRVETEPEGRSLRSSPGSHGRMPLERSRTLRTHDAAIGNRSWLRQNSNRHTVDHVATTAAALPSVQFDSTEIALSVPTRRLGRHGRVL